MVTGRIAAFTLVVVAVGLFPAPVRAQEKLAEEAEAEEAEGGRGEPELTPAASRADGRRAVVGA